MMAVLRATRTGSRLAPAPGRHRLALLDAGGREVDAVRFEVRVPYRGGSGKRKAISIPAVAPRCNRDRRA